MSKRLNVRFEDDIAIIEMTNGKNEFTHEFLDDLNEALDKVINNPDARALVTYSTGKHYSNGIDLVTLASEGMYQSLTFSKRFCAFMARLTTFPMPTVAAINGHAYAGGCVMSFSHDYRVMNRERGWFCLPEVNLPQLFTLTLLEILRYKIPMGNAQRDMVLMGKALTGPEALNLRVVDQVAPPSEVLSQAITLAKDLTKRGTFGREPMGDMKNDVYRKVVESLGEDKISYMNRYLVKSKF